MMIPRQRSSTSGAASSTTLARSSSPLAWYLTANRLSSLDPRIARLSILRKISLRQNLIDDAAAEAVPGWTALSELEELVHRDNKLTKAPDASIFKKLLVFYISFNEISSLSGLSRVTNTLKQLYVLKNEVTKMEEIDHFFELQILELGFNRLRAMENLQSIYRSGGWEEIRSKP